MGDKLKNMGKSALKSLVVTVPASFVASKLGVPGQVDTKVLRDIPAAALQSGAIIGAGALTSALSSLGKDVYDDSRNYLEERARFRRMQNRILADKGALTFVSPISNRTQVLPVGFSQVDATGFKGGAKVPKMTIVTKSVGHKVYDVAMGKEPLIDTSKVKSNFGKGATGTLNFMVNQGPAMAAIKGLNNVADRFPTLGYMIRSGGKGFSEVELPPTQCNGVHEDLGAKSKEILSKIPEEYRQVIGSALYSEDPELNIDRVRDLLPEELHADFDRYVGIEKCRLNFSENVHLNLIAQSGDFSIGSALGSLISKAASGVAKGATKLASKLASKTGEVAKKAAENTAKVAAEGAKSVAEGAKDAAGTVASNISKGAETAAKGLGETVAKTASSGHYADDFAKATVNNVKPETPPLENPKVEPKVPPKEPEPPKVEPKATEESKPEKLTRDQKDLIRNRERNKGNKTLGFIADKLGTDTDTVSDISTTIGKTVGRQIRRSQWNRTARAVITGQNPDVKDNQQARR